MPETRVSSLRGTTESAQRLASGTLIAADAAGNEANLRHEVELLLRQECRALGIPYVPYQFERALRGDYRHVAFADVVHGGVIIEYEPPKSFSAGRSQAVLQHAKNQAEEYAARMAHDEGRPIEEYVLIVWDGTHIAFGAADGVTARWESLVAFDNRQATRLLTLLHTQGYPFVHPGLLRTMVGPESQIGAALIPALFEAVVAAAANGITGQSKTTLLFKEWGRLFGQAAGIPTDRLKDFLTRQSQAHQKPYGEHIPCYLFSLHTFIAIVAKLVSALALPRASEDIKDTSVELRERIRTLESGRLFVDSGILNMLVGDFFSWPVDDLSWANIEAPLGDLLAQLGQLSFDMTRKNPESVRDLFKGIYEEFIPRELRHALGEVYTPDWLAGYALDEMGWLPQNDLLDPTCGTGTFILEAIRRRLMNERDNGGQDTAQALLRGLYGIDLNPLAVLAAKASLIVILADRLSSSTPVRLPIFLADAINTAAPSNEGCFVHRLQTEKGTREFRVPAAIVNSTSLHEFFEIVRTNVLSSIKTETILSAVRNYLVELDEKDKADITETIRVLVELHEEKWDGIWCSIIADRFAAGSIPQMSHIAGNPPWVKWSHLPTPYAEFIKPQCLEINVFSEDRYVGGIESDISTVITFQAIRKWLAPNGRLAFFITATVFSNESSQGFRRFAFPDGSPMCQVLAVEDFKDIQAFNGVTNHPALLIVKGGSATSFPVRYRIWSPPSTQTAFASSEDFRARSQYIDLLAEPVPGTDAGPWLKGSYDEHVIWRKLFDASVPSPYTARKGVTTDRNGIYFLKVDRPQTEYENLISVTNDPGAGRTSGIPTISMEIEATHVFPLMRGRGLRPFHAEPDPNYKILLPQRGMHGDPALLSDCPRTLRFLTRFKDELEKRGSFRRYQRNKPFWSTWNTGSYTFSPYKVLWKEMSGRRFCAAYVGTIDDPIIGPKMAIPDHKLYMAPVDTIEEAQFLTGILNAPTITNAIVAYAAQLSLGISVIEYLKIPALDLSSPDHRRIIQLSAIITDRGGSPTDQELVELDHFCVAAIVACE